MPVHDQREIRTRPLDGIGTTEAALDAELKRLLARGQEPSAVLDEALSRLQEGHEESVHSGLLHLASHLRFPAAEAREHWARILGHRDDLQARLEQPVDLRVALVDYFLAVFRRFSNPKIIELELFERTLASAYRDELTGLHNYRFFLEFLERELLRSDRHRASLSLVMLDIDDFKSFNDTHGHEAGNRALATVGELLRCSARACDMPVRYGGEEFALILPGTPEAGAQVAAERARKAVERQPFGEDSASPRWLTISAGVATAPLDGVTTPDLVAAADHALYRAKRDGKNRVVLASAAC